MYVLSISSPSLRVTPRFLRVSLVSLVFSSLRVSLRFSCPFISSSFRVSPISLRFSRLFVFPVFLSLSSFHLSRLFVSSSLSHLFVSPSSPRKSVATVSVARQLPSPRIGYSRLRI